MLEEACVYQNDAYLAMNEGEGAGLLGTAKAHDGSFRLSKPKPNIVYLNNTLNGELLQHFPVVESRWSPTRALYTY